MNQAKTQWSVNGQEPAQYEWEEKDGEVTMKFKLEYRLTFRKRIALMYHKFISWTINSLK